MPYLFDRLTEEQAHSYGLVLSATGINCNLVRGKHGWRIGVGFEDHDRARDAIQAYLAENKEYDLKRRVASQTYQKTLTGLWAALMLLGVHILVGMTADDRALIDLYGASAEQILKGQLYRVVTALLLHSTGIHLVGNMVGIALFGTAVGTVTGWGAGWLIILTCGAAGNLLNAAFYQSGHFSIGASTAVFGAVGFLAAHQFLKRYREPDRRIRAWIPLAGGLALLAFLGASPYADLMAHLLGFASGVASGLIYSLLIFRPVSTRYQIACFLITAGVLVACWMAAG